MEETATGRGKTLAILAADGFEESELFSPKETIEKLGGAVEVISLKDGKIQGLQHMEEGKSIKVDKKVADANPDDYHALLIPGGLFNPDQLRVDEDAKKFARAFFEKGKPVFAICHGPQVLISAGLVEGREMTSVKAVQVDLDNAGAKVRDQEVVNDHGLVTSRTPEDLEAFNDEISKEFALDAGDRHPSHRQGVLA